MTVAPRNDFMGSSFWLAMSSLVHRQRHCGGSVQTLDALQSSSATMVSRMLPPHATFWTEATHVSYRPLLICPLAHLSVGHNVPALVVKSAWHSASEAYVWPLPLP